ncbi:MAG: hypothetical protein WC648_02550 [Candidatus Paceibacterota bacterium]|jgi:hypothetical protein
MSVEFEEDFSSRSYSKPTTSVNHFLPQVSQDDSWLVRKGIVRDNKGAKRMYTGIVVIVLLASYLIYIHITNAPPKRPRTISDFNKMLYQNNAQ